MKANRVLIFTLTTLVMALIAGCDNKMPEVNDENCSNYEKIKAMPKEQREEFSSKCIRRGEFVPSTGRSW